MHPNPVFRKAEARKNIAFARERGFGVLAVNSRTGPLVSHIPFLLAENGASADLHLVRSNPIAQLGEIPAVIAAYGPDGYVSPDWYDVPDQVPTWNYIAVHLRGRLRPLPQEEMHDMLDRQSAAYESRLGPKTPWAMEKMTASARDRMMRQILPFRLEINAIDGTWKLNQNKSEKARMRAADHIAQSHGQDLEALAQLMRKPD